MGQDNPWTRPPACTLCGRSIGATGNPLELQPCSKCSRWMCLTCFLKHSEDDMAYEQRDNSGSLFRNDKKETDSHPTMKGSAMIGGDEYWVSAWTKVSKTGEKWISLAFTLKDRAVTKPGKAEAAPDNWNDEIPF